MAKVNIAVPNTGDVHKLIAMWLVRFSAETHGHDLSLNMRTDKPTDNCRNQIIRDFIVSKAGYEYLFFIDSDNPPLWNGRNPLELIEKDLDIVFLPTPMWVSSLAEKHENPVVWNAFNDDPDTGEWKEAQHRNGLKEVDAGGSGAIIIARRVLEVVRPAFVREWDADGVVSRGSDLLFCRRAREAGFKVWCSYDHPCHHFKTRDLADVAMIMQHHEPKAEKLQAVGA